jgi:hypothetical protein
MSRTVATLAAALLVAGALPASASEEEIHAWKKVTVVADAGRFGEVTVTAESTTGAKAAITALTVKVQGKTIAVPRAALQELSGLQLHTLQVRSEAGYDKHPWLYVVLDRWRANRPATTVAETVHFAIQGGKLRHRSISIRDRSGQTKWEKKDLK